jgi:hypothetical protein
MAAPTRSIDQGVNEKNLGVTGLVILSLRLQECGSSNIKELQIDAYFLISK